MSENQRTNQEVLDTIRQQLPEVPIKLKHGASEGDGAFYTDTRENVYKIYKLIDPSWDFYVECEEDDRRSAASLQVAEGKLVKDLPAGYVLRTTHRICKDTPGESFRIGQEVDYYKEEAEEFTVEEMEEIAACFGRK